MLFSEMLDRVEAQIAIGASVSFLIFTSTVYVGIFSNSLLTVCFFIASIAAILIGSLSMFSIAILISTKHTTSTDIPKYVGSFQCKIQGLMSASLIDQPCTNPAIIMNRNVSTTLQNLMDLVFRDLVESALGDLALPGIDSTTHLKNDAWEALHKFYTKIKNIDPVQFLTQDVVIRITRHLEKIRLSHPNQESKEKGTPYLLSSFLVNQQSELELLRKFADVLIVNLLPRPYVDCLPLRHFLRELLACQVLLPGINQLCEPDTINQQLVTHLHVRQMLKRNYAYAASYEDFVSLIEDCDDLNELQQIRNNIVTEIAQATAISSVKRSKGGELEQEFISSVPLGTNTSKVDLLQARNLQRYIKQLTYAKLQCERRLRLLGVGVQIGDTPRSTASASNFVEDVVPSFKTVMRNLGLRNQLETYLAQQGTAQVGLLKFWVATQELRRLERKAALTLGAQIFYSYFHGSNPIMKVDKSLMKGMEGYITGDRGPEAFFQAQDLAWKVLEDRHYPSFLVVLTCRMTGRQNSGSSLQSETDSATDSTKERNFSWKDVGSREESDEQGVFVEWSEQTQLAQSRMEQLDARLAVKLQALTSLRAVAPSDKTLVTGLEREVDILQTERRELESWLHQAETWAAHMGRWKATVAIPQNPDDKEFVRFPVEVHLDDEDIMAASSTTAPVSRKRVAMSWIVRRQVAEFYALHNKLRQQCAWLKSAQLPALSGKTLFGKPNDRAYLEGAQDKLQSFLDAVMADDQLNKSEGLFMFLHNPPACLRPSVNAPKKSSRFFFSTLFKGEATRESDEDGDHDNVPAPDETDGLPSVFMDDTRDGIAEPIYHLISEVFELRGVFGWLRRTLVTFVQITYGRTINRQLRDVVSSLFTDQAILSYVQTLVKTWWPDGLLLPSQPERSAQEKRRTKQEARNLLIANIPDVFFQLLGQQNARRGILKVYHALQDERLNKQLFYDLLEVIIKDGFPELSFH